MKKYGIFYGSSTGTTADVASRLAQMFEVDKSDVKDVAKASPVEVADYDTLLLGTSTWGSGDLQDDWYDFLDGLEAMDLRGKKIALFGCGDETMADTFCGAVGVLRDRLEKTGATFVGDFDTAGYDFHESGAVRPDGMAVGLLLDDVNHPELTDRRMRQWASEVKDASR